MEPKFRFNRDQDFVNQYLREIKDYPQLTREQERALLEEYHKTGEKSVFDRIVLSNLRFVVSVSVKYQNQGLSLPELINEGNLGLMEAVRRFNPAKYSVKFISYAVWWIRQAIIKSLYETSRLVRVSAEKESKMKRINRMADLSLQEYGFIDIEYVAERSDSSLNMVEEVLSLTGNQISMDKAISEENDSTVYDLIADETMERPDAFLDRDSIRQEIEAMLGSLTEQEKQIVKYYFGLDSDTDFNLMQVGRKLKISKERVRQVKMRALDKMREALAMLQHEEVAA